MQADAAAPNALNLTISLYDRENNTVHFQYSTDKVENNALTPIESASTSGSLTYKVIDDEKSLLIRNVDLKNIQKQGLGVMLGPTAKN